MERKKSMLFSKKKCLNHEVVLCEIYDESTKEKVKKLFYGSGISFFIKYKKLWSNSEEELMNKAGEPKKRKQERAPKYYYEVMVHQSQKNMARHMIQAKIEQADETILFIENSTGQKKRIPFLLMWS